MRAAAGSLAALEVAIRRRRAALAGCQAIGVHAKAHRATRLAPFEARVLEDAVEPFSLGLRLFVAMIAGHILMEVFGSFIVSGFSGGPMGWGVGALSFLFIIFVSALELLVAAIQAYVFALLTTLYLNDAVNLH